MQDRKYNIIAINEKTGMRVQMNAYPLTHIQACANLRKITSRKFRRVILEQV